MFALNNENENLDRPHDFYRDPLQSEAVKCHPLLKSIKGKVHELMKEWPEHPTLTTVCLLNFDTNYTVTTVITTESRNIQDYREKIKYSQNHKM